jgi:hypothetical protein
VAAQDQQPGGARPGRQQRGAGARPETAPVAAAAVPAAGAVAALRGIGTATASRGGAQPESARLL